jgi:hypothetical protein
MGARAVHGVVSGGVFVEPMEGGRHTGRPSIARRRIAPNRRKINSLGKFGGSALRGVQT